MIKIPNKIIQEIFRSCSNIVQHYCGEDINDYSQNQEIQSINPFVINSSDCKLLLTNNIQDENISNFDYVILVNRKPTRALYQQEKIKFKQWLKHPLFIDMSPDDIVKSWKGKFFYTKEDASTHTLGLRSPQLGAIYAFMSNEQTAHQRNIIVMPTGTGKTETMLSILIANQCRKLIVTVPSDALREQLFNKFLSLGVLANPDFNIVSSDCIKPNVAMIRESASRLEWEEIIDKTNVIITTMSLIGKTSSEIKDLLSDKISHVFVDEAHHSEAATWSEFLDYFTDQKITLFTATPFRNDGKKIKGNFIYTFSLKDAQSQGYYKPIKFVPIREYDNKLADKIIAETAVRQLLEDHANGYDHILMARCASKKRAEEVLKYYQVFENLNPVIIYSSITGKSAIVESIKRKEHKIIICVNMLGEGFDLPELKIAAVHDAKQSLAITLQFIGRFTRSAHDKHLGEASFVTNIANPPIEKELQDLYARDANWNLLLPVLNDGTTQYEKDLNNYIQSFGNLDESKVPFQNIYPALSTTIYRTGREWQPDKWTTIFKKDDFEYMYSSKNADNDTLVIILGNVEQPEWGKTNDIQNVMWNLIIVHWYCTPSYNHAYINCSFKFNTDLLAKAIFGGEEILSRISGNNVFRVLSEVKRFAVVNFGGRKAYQGNISFKSYYGKDVQDGLTLTEQKKLTKNNIFGIGYRDGAKISIGCSIKGKIWSYLRGSLLDYQNWSRKIGYLVEDDTINPDVILQNTITPKLIRELPAVYPIGIDWDPELYQVISEHRIKIKMYGFEYYLWDVELELVEKDISDTIEFNIKVNNTLSHFKIEYGTDNNEISYSVCHIGGPKLGIVISNKVYDDICDYFNQDNSAPVIYFADGSILYANTFVETNATITPYDKEKLIPLDWVGVDLSNESQHVEPYEQDSIQYYMAQKIRDKYDIIYDDDGSGEIADLIGIKQIENEIHLYLYHLKFARGGVVSNQISNFYEVCGQAQKCIKWNDREKHKELFSRLFARKTKKYEGRECSRILKGSVDDLEKLSELINWKMDVKFHVAIVQPALSASEPGDNILKLLGVTATYIKDVANIDLEVYCSQ